MAQKKPRVLFDGEAARPPRRSFNAEKWKAFRERFPNGVKARRRDSDERPGRELCAFYVRRSVKGEEVSALFEKFGTVTDVLVFGEQHEAYVVFESVAEAKAAKHALDLTTHYEGTVHDIILKKAVNDFSGCNRGALVMVNQPYDKLRMDFRKVPQDFREYVSPPSKSTKKADDSTPPISLFFGLK